MKRRRSVSFLWKKGWIKSKRQDVGSGTHYREWKIDPVWNTG